MYRKATPSQMNKFERLTAQWAEDVNPGENWSLTRYYHASNPRIMKQASGGRNPPREG
jgi:hypothetical protein